MGSLFRNLLVVGFLSTIMACGNDNDDTAAAAPDTPAENPVATPSENEPTSPADFDWLSTRFEEDVEECEGVWRFTIKADRSFTSTTCNAEQNKSGKISNSDLARVQGAVEVLSQAEASSQFNCSNIENNAGLKDQKVSMLANNNKRYTLYTRGEERECYRGTQSEISNLRDLLYELRSIYVNSYR